MRLIDADDPILRGRLYTYTRYSGIDEAPNEYAVHELDLAPTVEERKKGEWEHETVSSVEGIFKLSSCFCSVCDCHVAQEANFCPNCGADMRGEEDGKKTKRHNYSFGL